METIRKTESKIGKNDEPSHIPMQMLRPQASSSWLVPPGLTIKIPVHSRRAQKVTKRLEQELSGNSNKDEDNSPKTLNDKNQQALSQKFRQVNTLL